jgi:Na+-driven multidrug efflux pump
MESAFGNMIAKNEKEEVEKIFNWFEWIMFTITTILMIVTLVMCIPFIKIFTEGIIDANYIRPAFCYMFIAAEYMYCIRTPYLYLVHASGNFKETRTYAIIEPIINIIFSLLLVKKYGLIGIMIGTFLAMAYRTIVYIIYINNNYYKRNIWKIIKQWFVSFIIIFISLIINKIIIPTNINNILNWVFWAILYTLPTIIVSFGINIIFNKKQIRYSFEKIFTLKKMNNIYYK